MSAHEFFNRLRRVAAASEGTGTEVFLFNVVGEDGGQWTLDLTKRPPTCVAETHPAPSCTIELSTRTLEAIRGAPKSITAAMTSGAIKFDGTPDSGAQLLPILLSALSDTVPGIDCFFAPLTAEEFVKTKWPNEFIAVHEPVSRLDPLLRIPELADIHALLDSNRNAIVGVYPPGTSDDGKSIVVSAKAARDFYARNYQMVIDLIDTDIPALQVWLQKIKRQLGLPPTVVTKCLAFANRAGSGTLPHFDTAATFVVQLHGEKVWQVARNRHVVNPTYRYLLEGDGVWTRAGFRLGKVAGMPTSLPEDTERVTFRRGTVAFIPRGWWHGTHATEDSLALNFFFTQPDWATLVGNHITARLRQHEHWRELANGAGATDERRDAARRRLATLLEGFQKDLGDLEPANIFDGLVDSMLVK